MLYVLKKKKKKHLTFGTVGHTMKYDESIHRPITYKAIEIAQVRKKGFYNS